MEASLQPLYNTVCLEVITEQGASALPSSVPNSRQQSFSIQKMEVQGASPTSRTHVSPNGLSTI